MMKIEPKNKPTANSEFPGWQEQELPKPVEDRLKPPDMEDFMRLMRSSPVREKDNPITDNREIIKSLPDESKEQKSTVKKTASLKVPDVSKEVPKTGVKERPTGSDIWGGLSRKGNPIFSILSAI